MTYLLADWTAQTFEGRHFLGINTMRLLRSALVGGVPTHSLTSPAHPYALTHTSCLTTPINPREP